MSKIKVLIASILACMLLTHMGLAQAQASYVTALPTLNTPTISLATGTYSGPQTVKLSGPAGATIYYTTNGKTPTTHSTKYTKAIVITKTTTIKAIAAKAHYNNSKILTVKLTIKPLAIAAPKALIKAGTYDKAQTVKLTGPAGAVIYYTVNGKTPTTKSTKYTKPIVVTKNTTIKAIAVTKRAGYKNSKIMIVTYKITVPVPSTAYIPAEKVFPLGGGTLTVKAPAGVTMYIKFKNRIEDSNVSKSNYAAKLLPGKTATVKINSDTELQILMVKAGYADKLVSRVYTCRAQKVVPMGNDYCQQVLKGINWARYNLTIKHADGTTSTHTSPAAMDSRLVKICQAWAMKLATEHKLYHTGYAIDESVCAVQGVFIDPINDVGPTSVAHNADLALPSITLIGVGASRALDGTVYVVVEGGDEATVKALAEKLGID